MDVIESGNLAPGNTIQNISNLLRPALLIAFLATSRQADDHLPPKRKPQHSIDGADRGSVPPGS
jgi:hypothetical protein